MFGNPNLRQPKLLPLVLEALSQGRGRRKKRLHGFFVAGDGLVLLADNIGGLNEDRRLQPVVDPAATSCMCFVPVVILPRGNDPVGK